MSTFDDYVAALAAKGKENAISDRDVTVPRQFRDDDHKKQFRGFIEMMQRDIDRGQDMYKAHYNANHANIAVVAASITLWSDSEGEAMVDHRLLPRSKRKKYDPDHTNTGLQHDYLGPIPLFDGKEFDTMFRISRSRLILSFTWKLPIDWEMWELLWKHGCLWL
jgi:hypothetical protein